MLHELSALCVPCAALLRAGPLVSPAVAAAPVHLARSEAPPERGGSVAMSAVAITA